MESWSSILITVVSALAGLGVTAIGIIGGVYMKRLDRRLKMRELTTEIGRYIQWAENSNTFKMMSSDDQKETLLEQLRIFAQENEITITDTQLIILIENSIKPLVKLEKIMKLRKEGTHED